MNRSMLGALLLAAALALDSPAAVYVWDNSSGDNEWTNPQNWTSNSGSPGRSDTATFDDTMIGACRISSNVIVGTLLVTNSSGTVDFDIPAGITLATVTYRQSYLTSNSGNRVIMHGGGTFAPTGDVVLAFKNSTVGAFATKAELVVSNLVFDSSNLNNLWVSYNGHSIGVMTGTLDLVNASLVWKGNPDCLVTKAGLVVGGYSAGTSLGTLLLPGALTNITAGTEFRIGTQNGTPNVIDFGPGSSIRSIKIGTDLIIRAARFISNRDGVTVTGFPSRIELTIGSPTTRGNLYAGYFYGSALPVVLTNFASFNAWISDLWVCRIDNNGAGTCTGTLDVSEASMTDPQGSITPTSLAVSTLGVGGMNAGLFYGTLYLPSTLTSITCNSFDLGRAGALRNGAAIISLGTGSRPIVFTVASSFSSGLGGFRYITAGPVTNSGFPPGSTLRIGSPTNRADVKLGYISAQGTSCRFGNGFATVELHATSLTSGFGANNSHWHTVTNDFRDATSLVWNVSGDIVLGPGAADYIYTYLPAGGSVACSNLTMGQTGLSNYPGWRALLVLSNTAFAVSNAVTIRETAVVTNIVNGLSSGFDIGSTNLDIQDPQGTATYADYGRMAIRFAGDPIDATQNYWGLRMKGHAIGLIAGLTSTVPQRLSWRTDGLSAGVLARFGVHYDALNDVTYVGVPGVRKAVGATILAR